MIDKITPRPNTSVEELLKKDGVQDLDPVITGKHTYVAPFVNSEECEYLVIEDVFPNGRPALEKSGFIFTDRETVDKVERMKVCTCLNPLHTALAVFGCLLDYKLIAEEMKDSTLKTLVERLGYQEGLPVVMDPGILNPKEFLDTVLGIRIPNPFMPDTPQRIATDIRPENDPSCICRMASEWHQKLAKEKEQIGFLVLPSFRPGNALDIEKRGFSDYISLLKEITGIVTSSLSGLLNVQRLSAYQAWRILCKA